MRSNSASFDDWSAYSRRPGRARARLRAALSILQVLALAAAAFFVLPLIVKADPDPIELSPGQEARRSALNCEFTGQIAYPGDTVYCHQRIGTNTDLDATFYLFVDEDSLKVHECLPQHIPQDCPRNLLQQVPSSDPRFTRFLNYWSLSVHTRPIITRSLPEDFDVAIDPRDAQICPQKLLRSYDGGANPANTDRSKMCNLGVLRGIAGPRAFADSQEPVYERHYSIGMTEANADEDQSWARGWALEFDYIIRAEIPADDTCPTPRITFGICSTPVYERP